MSSGLKPGKPSPLGATVCKQGVNFALFSEHADRVELCLYGHDGKQAEQRFDLVRRSDDIWHGLLPGGRAGLHYGYRVHGPFDPENGHRFNPHKLLIDPYARRLDSELQITDVHYGYVRDSTEADLSFDKRDSAAFVPKCVVPPLPQTTTESAKPEWPWSDAVIYEAHVKGLSRNYTGLSADCRGRYAALGHPEMINYFKKVGINALELLPVHYFADDDFLLARKLSNYWGYQSLGFFCAANRYAQQGADACAELASAVASLHDADIKVILDVVYNHTGESNELGPTVSFRGIDNLAYYHLQDNRRYYLNYSGTGNTLRVDHPRVLQMIMDSLRYWHSEIGVDGFRFDLASILGRDSRGFDSGAGFFRAIAQDPILQTAQMIAEPWDLGPDGYQLGQYPRRWSEWNDRYRDTVRRFWLTDDAVRTEFARRLLGSSDLFEHPASVAATANSLSRQPTSSINFVTAHDGYCLADVVSFEQKHNENNGENNADGHNGEVSNNHGFEGSSDNAKINKLREKQQRNLLATLMVSQGIPMLLAGDERHRTQAGNNNAYCQDNEINWIDWEENEAANQLTTFTNELISLRKRFPVLRQPWYLHAQHVSPSGHADVVWFRQDGKTMSDQDWHNADDRFLGVQLTGDAVPDTPGYPDIKASPSLLLLFNASNQAVEFPLDGSELASQHWHPELDTNLPSAKDSGDHQRQAIDPKRVVCEAKSLRVMSSALPEEAL